MKVLTFSYQLEESLVAIEDLLGGVSIYMQATEVLAQIEAEVGSLAGKHIICRGQDGLWDLLVPEAQAAKTEVPIYPLGTDTLEEAKVKLRHLVVTGQVMGKIP